MNRVALIVFLSCLVTLLTGCAQDQPIWETVKVSDVIPRRSTSNQSRSLLKKADFKVYIFDIPAANANVLDRIWPLLSTKPLKLNDGKAFAANQFSVGFGRVRSWNQIADMLRAAGAKKYLTVSMMIPQRLANDLTIAEFNTEQPIFYTAADGSAQGLTANPGALVLRIKADPVPASRGLCHLVAKPIYSPQIRTAIRQMVARAKAGEVPFDFLGFELNMALDDLIFLGPKKFIDNRITLGGMFFRRPDWPMLRTYLIVCTSISY